MTTSAKTSLFNSSTSSRIQVVRGIAIIAVVLIHTLPVGALQVWVRPFLNIAVGLFLFLSGMLSKASKWKPGKRLFKILVPYFLWTLIYVVFFFYMLPSEIPVEFLKRLILGNVTPAMYYVFVYCELTLLIPLIDKLAKSKLKMLGFAISPIEIIVMRMLPALLGYQLPEVVNTIMELSCLWCFSFFYLGYLVGNGMLKISLSNAKLIVLSIVGLVLQFGEGYWLYLRGDENCGTQAKISILITTSFFALLMYRYVHSNAGIPGFIKFIGDHSFGIFFAHYLFVILLRKMTLLNDCLVFPLNGIIVLGVSLLLSWGGSKLPGKAGKYLAFY